MTALEVDDLSASTISYVTPEHAATAYQWPTSKGYGQTVAIVEFGGGFTSQNLTSTFNYIGVPTPSVTFVSVDGATNNPANSASTALSKSTVQGPFSSVSRPSTFTS